jgi:hypothetical protein
MTFGRPFGIVMTALFQENTRKGQEKISDSCRCRTRITLAPGFSPVA